ncbi:MAG: DUF364 domain-containing protein [Castellaniella sp.]|uniref:DUF364 domain-containing protein n=1 Tax=Castellaniella sp. TaxID=1955812 RepID=UPI002A369F47|nr:DUF364 domain-containing protein [Castellaniella sp.]MDY0309722.1 DUF364 domain-containing protein [Castellaniella sp.]
MSHSSSLLQDLLAETLARLGADASQRVIERAVVGLFFTGVLLDNGTCGLSASPIKDIPAAVCCSSSLSALPAPGKLRGRPVLDVLKDLAPEVGPMRRTLAIATLNALIETLWQRDGTPDGIQLSTGDACDALQLQPKEKVVLVGAFTPYMRAFRREGRDYRVLEMDPATLKPEELPHYAPADTAPAVVPWGDVLISTATTLINGTLDGLLALTRPDTRIAVIGPTAPLLPNPYRLRGVHVVGGTRVRQDEGQRLLDLLSEGASGYHFFERQADRVNLVL